MVFRQQSRRIILIDELRGLCIILMIVYHAAYHIDRSLVAIPIFHARLLQVFLQPFVAGIFITISGTVSRYSKSSLKRGILVFLCGLLVTAVTFFVTPDDLIIFGILHLIGFTMIIQGIFGRKSNVNRPDRMPAIPGAMLFFAIFLVAYGVPGGYLGVPGTDLYIVLPGVLYTSLWLSPLGFPAAGFISADYFPIIPWIFLFFAGTCIGAMFRGGGAPDFFYRSHIRFLGAAGRHTLIIYLLHMPVILGLIWVAQWVMTSVRIVT